MREIEVGNNVLSKTSEDVKKGLECCYKGNACRGHCPYDGPENGIKGCTSKLSRDALALINRLEADNIAKAIVIEQLEREKKDLLEERELNDFLRDKAKELEAQAPKWISVEERLPDIDAEVLIYTDEGLYDVAQYSGGERFWTLERNPVCWVTASGVTHWMPLPEPPTAGAKPRTTENVEGEENA